MVAADARTAITFALSPGQAGDAPHGRALLERFGPPNRPLHLLMDKAYEGNESRQLALDLGFTGDSLVNRFSEEPSIFGARRAVLPTSGANVLVTDAGMPVLRESCRSPKTGLNWANESHC